MAGSLSISYFKDNPDKARLLIASAIICIIMVFLYTFVYSKLIARIKILKHENSALGSELERGLQALNEHKPLSMEEEVMMKEMEEKINLAVPLESNIPVLLKNLAALARDFNINDLSLDTIDEEGDADDIDQVYNYGMKEIEISEETMMEDMEMDSENSFEIKKKEIPLHISFNCEYTDLAFFLDALKTIERLIVVKRLKIERSFPLIDVDMKLAAFVRVQNNQLE